MFASLKNLVSSPLTKYMTIAIVVLLAALGSALYLSYKFYGDKQVAEQQVSQLEVDVEEQSEQTERTLEGKEIIGEAVANVREGERDIDNALEKLQDERSEPTPSNPTEVKQNGSEDATEPCVNILSDDDIRMLRKAHCVTDGDTSNCN